MVVRVAAEKAVARAAVETGAVARAAAQGMAELRGEGAVVVTVEARPTRRLAATIGD